MTREPGLSIIVVPEDGGASRTYRFTRRRLRLYVTVGGAAALVLVLMVGSWFYLAIRAARVSRLEDRIAQFEAERGQIAELARTLDELEARYGDIRGLFGMDSLGASDLWLPPPGAGRLRTPSAGDTVSAPTAWPLSERGYVTQSLLEGDKGEHPGVDIAVPTDTYIRAAGAGIVADVGEDPIYGNYVAVDHGQGYSSLYAHASTTFVTPGESVRRGEVIALSGNTGRSTAPHLHFEILLDGAPVDPLTLVRPPA